jgi:hypothetical protein
MLVAVFAFISQTIVCRNYFIPSIERIFLEFKSSSVGALYGFLI